jgi:phage/conjugal plasmid C-4 type zinc finger TraR family protein
MGDGIDKDQAADEFHREQAIQEHFNRGIRNAMNSAPVECIDCGEEIPEARRLAVPGCTRCVECQADFELHQHWRAL